MKPSKPKPNTNKSKPMLLLSLSGLILFSTVALFACTKSQDKSSSSKPSTRKYKSEPAFQKEGELFFLSNAKDDTLAKIDIEIAEEEGEIQQGLMHRTSMNYEVGMLFIFEFEENRAFWMKNTAIALDILFINEAEEIISIQKNTIPYSEESIPSEGLAKYVLEVKAGFCDTYKIEPGAKVSFQRQTMS